MKIEEKANVYNERASDDGECWAPPGGNKACVVAGKTIPDWPNSVWDWNGHNHTEYCGVLISDDERKMLCFAWENRKEVFYSEFPIG